MATPYSLVLEFTRAHQAGQPHSFEFVPQSYLLRSPGGGFESAQFPWTGELMADLRDAREPGCDPEVIHRIGAVLREFLAGVGWDLHERAILDAARAGAPILLTLRSAAAELYALPWEFVALRATGQLLGGIPGLLIRYEWPQTLAVPDRVDPTARRRRVLFAWSAAGGAVPADAHLAALRDLLGPDTFDPARDVLAHASLGAIDQTLDDAARVGPPIDVLHLLCHGAALGGGYGLALDDAREPGLPAVVDAGRVQQLLAAHAGMVRLVVLAACDSGNAGQPGNHLGSIAQRIHRAGLAAVVASRYPLSLAGSTRFTESFYAALARDDLPLERAFVAARDALARDPGQLDWASIQLYARDADGEATYPLHRPRPAAPAAEPAAAPVSPAPEVPAIVASPGSSEHAAEDSSSGKRPLLLGLAAVILVGAAALAFIWLGPKSAPADPPPATSPPPVDPASTPVTPDPSTPTDPPTDPPPPVDPPPVTAPATTGAADPPQTEPTKTPAGKSEAPAASRPGKCPAALVTYVGQLLRDSNTGAGKIVLTIVAGKDGGLEARHTRGDASLLSRARTQLEAANPSRVKSLGAAALPCKLERTWLP